MKSALVFGASQGMGAHLASSLASNGWAVVGVGSSSLKSSANPVFDYRQIDFSEMNSAETLSQLLYEVEPRLVIHNAVTYDATATSTLEEIETMFRVNALLPYVAIRKYIADIVASNPFTCVVVNSDSIYHANETSAVYAASKAALRVLTSGLADACRFKEAAIATLLLGPISDPKKMSDFTRVAERTGVEIDEVIKAFLRKSNPSIVLSSLIDFDSCFKSIEYIVSLGNKANGMLCKMDGGSSGSLV